MNFIRIQASRPPLVSQTYLLRKDQLLGSIGVQVKKLLDAVDDVQRESVVRMSKPLDDPQTARLFKKKLDVL